MNNINTKLYNNIMKDVSKIIKKHLNEEISNNYLNKALIDWNGGNNISQNNVNIQVTGQDINPKETELRIWMKTYGLPEYEKDTARMIKEKYWDEDCEGFNLKQWEDRCCSDFEAFAMLAYSIDKLSDLKTHDARDLGLWGFSWFDGDAGKYGTIGDYCIKMARSKKFYNDFKIIFDWVKTYIIYENFIWGGWKVYVFIIEHPDLEPKWGERLDPYKLDELDPDEIPLADMY